MNREERNLGVRVSGRIDKTRKKEKEMRKKEEMREKGKRKKYENLVRKRRVGGSRRRRSGRWGFGGEEGKEIKPENHGGIHRDWALHQSPCSLLLPSFIARYSLLLTSPPPPPPPPPSFITSTANII